MSIKTLLVPQDGSDSSAAVLDTALLVGQRFNAHLEVLHIRRPTQDTLPFALSSTSSQLKDSVVKEADDDQREAAALVHEVFERFCKANQLSLSKVPCNPPRVTAAWYEEVGRISDTLVRRGRLVDLIMVARPERGSPGVRRSPAGENLEAVLLQSGRPIIMVPPNAPKSVGTRVAVGWNASAVAARAVGGAMPFLCGADSVTLLASEKRAPSAQALASRLRWHGVEATVSVFTQGAGSVGETLLKESQRLGVDLLVVGGYSQMRAKQLLFGGVTRHFLSAAELPVLMSH